MNAMMIKWTFSEVSKIKMDQSCNHTKFDLHVIKISLSNAGMHANQDFYLVQVNVSHQIIDSIQEIK